MQRDYLDGAVESLECHLADVRPRCCTVEVCRGGRIDENLVDLRRGGKPRCKVHGCSEAVTVPRQHVAVSESATAEREDVVFAEEGQDLGGHACRCGGARVG